MTGNYILKGITLRMIILLFDRVEYYTNNEWL